MAAGLVPPTLRQLLPFLAKRTNADLIVLKELIDAGKIRPVIDRTYPLSETAAAIRYVEQGHARARSSSP